MTALARTWIDGFRLPVVPDWWYCANQNMLVLNCSKEEQTLFFAACQLTILLSALIYFAPALQTVSLFIIIWLIRCIINMSYPMMILLRLKLLCCFHPIIMYIPILQNILWAGLGYLRISWLSTENDRKNFVIIEIISMITNAIQDIIINMFFIVLAAKNMKTLSMSNVSSSPMSV